MYIGNDLQIAHPSYKIIDDISSGFNGSTTSFALQVSGATPVPFPISTQQVMISVNGVVQEPDPNGSAGFKLLGSNIVFSSAPANGHAFFGVINAGADYVTAGSEFPDGSVTAPSFTFQDDQDTGWYRLSSGSVGYSANGTQILDFDGNGLNISDNKKAQFGGGNDLQIYHDASNSYINHNGTGGFVVRATTNDLYLQSDSNIFIGDVGGNEYAIKCVDNAQVELYYDNSKKLHTFSGGVKFFGTLEADDSDKIKLGDGADLQIYFDGSNSYIKEPAATAGQLIIDGWNGTDIRQGSTGEHMIRAIGGGAVELYYDNVKQINTTSTGVTLGDSKRIDFGDGADLKIYHDGTNSYILNSTGNIRIFSDASNEAISIVAAGAVSLSHANAVKLATYASGLYVTGNIVANQDNATLVLGAGNDIEIYHNGSNSYIKNNHASSFYIQSGGNLLLENTNNDNYFKGIANGAVELYYDNIKTFETIEKGGIFRGAAGGDGELHLYADAGSANADLWRLKAESGAAEFDIGNYASGSWENNIRCNANNSVDLYYDNTKKFETTATGVTVAGSVTDDKGDLRDIPVNAGSSAMTLSASDAGKVVATTSGGWVIPTGLSSGNTFTLLNDSGSTQTINATALTTLYNTADGANVKASTLTLGARSMATIWMGSGTTGYIQASALTVS